MAPTSALRLSPAVAPGGPFSGCAQIHVIQNGTTSHKRGKNLQRGENALELTLGAIQLGSHLQPVLCLGDPGQGSSASVFPEGNPGEQA